MVACDWNLERMTKLTRPLILLALLCALCLNAAAQASRAKFPQPPTVARGAKLRVVHEDKRFFEGPAWDAATKSLYFTVFEDKVTEIRRLDAQGNVTTWMKNTQGINGMRLARNGRLLAAQAYGHKLLSIKIGATGPADVQTLSGDFNGQPYVQPNDLAEAPNGDLYYTDPDFDGKVKSSVFRRSAAGQVTRIIPNLKNPNGILVSANGQTLYVSDSFDLCVYSFPIKADGSVNVGEMKLFFSPLTENKNEPDGMCADEQGNLYFAMRGGVWVVTPAGKALGLIPIKEFASNVAFGGADRKTLFVTGEGKVYALPMKVRGQ